MFQLVLKGRLRGGPVRREGLKVRGLAAFLSEKRAGREDPPGESYIELSIRPPPETRTFFEADGRFTVSHRATEPLSLRI